MESIRSVQSAEMLGIFSESKVVLNGSPDSIDSVDSADSGVDRSELVHRTNAIAAVSKVLINTAIEAVPTTPTGKSQLDHTECVRACHCQITTLLINVVNTGNPMTSQLQCNWFNR